MGPGFLPTRMLRAFSVCGINWLQQDDLRLGLLHKQLSLIDVGDRVFAALEVDGV